MENKIKRIENMLKSVRTEIADSQSNLEIAYRHNDYRFIADCVSNIESETKVADYLEMVIRILKE